LACSHGRAWKPRTTRSASSCSAHLQWFYFKNSKTKLGAS
jgi:hypothetical protein